MALYFNDTTTKNGLLQVCEDEVFSNYGDITNNTDLTYKFTRLLNEALNRVSSLILKSDGRWQHGDFNYPYLSIARTSLVTTVGSEQQDYSLDVSHVKILGVEVLDSSGNWTTLTPIDQADLYEVGVTDFLKTAGLPKYYDKIENSIILYPKPLGTAVTSALGLKIRYQGPPSYFTSGDTTKTPGFNPIYHELVALIACRNYASSKNYPSAKGLTERVQILEDALVEDYALRSKDEHIKISSRGSKHKFN